MTDAILVTGANGFIGTHLVKALESAGHCVYTHTIETGDIARCPLDFDVAHVFHLAGRTFVPDSWNSPGEFYDTNVMGTVNVLELCRRRRASITFISSYVYGQPQALPITEEHPLQAFNPYCHTKIVAESIVRYYHAHFRVPAVVVRPFNIYGPGQAKDFLIPTLIRQALDGTAEAIIVTDLRPRRDYIHVKDIVSLLLSTLNRREGGTYNAGSGYSVGIPDLVQEINALTGNSKPVRSSAKIRPEEVLNVVADISKAGRELAWRPQIGLRDGLRDTIDWVKRTTGAEQ
jgi:nucleoside-diphosphate-sugar epimerase